MSTLKIPIPADVAPSNRQLFEDNYKKILGVHRCSILFSCDHKIEHLNPIDPEILFTTAAALQPMVMAAPVGLIARYASDYPSIPYIAKVSDKTNLATDDDPLSTLLWDTNQVIQLQENSVDIVGIGITIYVGSDYESEMMAAAAQAILHAHAQGLVAIVWIYPRGSHIQQSSLTNAQLLAGATGIATSLGADMVKIKPPIDSYDWIKLAVQSAGNTKIVCAGLEKTTNEILIERTTEYIRGGIAGVALGRNLFERSIAEAQNLVQALRALN